MSSDAQPAFDVESLRSAVRRVGAEWNAADLAQIEAARITLESSLAPLQAALAAYSGGTIPDGAEMRAAAVSLKKETAFLETLVDAAAAFLRCLPAADGGHDYNSAGEVRAAHESEPAESYAG